MRQKVYPIYKIFLSSSNFFLLKNTFKQTVSFQCFYTICKVSYIKLNFELKVDHNVYFKKPETEFE